MRSRIGWAHGSRCNAGELGGRPKPQSLPPTQDAQHYTTTTFLYERLLRGWLAITYIYTYHIITRKIPPTYIRQRPLPRHPILHDHNFCRTGALTFITTTPIGKNLISDVTFCTKLGSTQPKQEISAHLHIMAIYIAHISHNRHNRRWCTFFKLADFFPQRTQKELL